MLFFFTPIDKKVRYDLWEERRSHFLWWFLWCFFSLQTELWFKARIRQYTKLEARFLPNPIRSTISFLTTNFPSLKIKNFWMVGMVKKAANISSEILIKLSIKTFTDNSENNKIPRRLNPLGIFIYKNI